MFRDPADAGDLAGMSAIAGNILYVGGPYPTRPTDVTCNGSTQFTVRTGVSTSFIVTATFARFYPSVLDFRATTANPIIQHQTDAAPAIVGDLMTFHAQSVDSGGAGASTGGALDVYAGDGEDGDDHGGHAYFGGGRNTGAGTGVDGNVGLNARAGDAVNFQSMERGIYVRDCVTVPGAASANGGFLYSNSGALTWRGSSGTVTVMGSAGPHCSACGYDAWVVASINPTWRSWHFICGHCGAEYRGGPRQVLDRLSPQQGCEILRPNMSWHEVSEVMKAA
ncbi:MAG: hypothetical protein JRD89_19515 [Deltaproteobacteria bacterium]|nr:hypothetical protein [Deltaproteobacteria bacterium]